MSRRQQWVYHIEPAQFPEDFPERLKRFKDAAGLSWRGLARRLRVSTRCVWRWKAGMRPDPGHLFSLFTAAEEMGLLHILLHGAKGQPAAVIDTHRVVVDALGLPHPASGIPIAVSDNITLDYRTLASGKLPVPGTA